MGFYCGYPKDESILIYNKEREKCATDYPAGELGGALRLAAACLWSVTRISWLFEKTEKYCGLFI